MGVNLGHGLRLCENMVLRRVVPVESEEIRDNFHQDSRSLDNIWIWNLPSSKVDLTATFAGKTYVLRIWFDD
jgi:hypothetical protein